MQDNEVQCKFIELSLNVKKKMITTLDGSVIIFTRKEPTLRDRDNKNILL